MAMAAVFHLGQWDYVAELERQREALGGKRSDQLVVSCAEVRDRLPGRWERAYPHALQLSTPGGEVAEADFSAALQYAVGELKVREIVCVVHTDCGRTPELGTGGGSFMDRMRDGARRHREEMAQAKERLRSIVHDADRAACFQAQVVGVLEAGEGGPLLGFLPEKDAFVPL